MDARSRRNAVKWLFAIYCLMMLWLLLLHRIGSGPGVGQFNLRPMETMSRYLWVLRHSSDRVQRWNAAANLFGNVGLFLPFGIFLPVLFSELRKFLWFGLLSFQVILLLELLQAATGLGTFDVDDLILNVLGGFLGWCIWKLIHNLSKK